MNKAPIVFFAYKRPEHTRRSLESLARCEGATESELFIYCDGSREKKEVEAVDEVRSIVKSRKWCGTVHIIERDENIGLANSIIKGVTERVNTNGSVIVLEDDLILSSHFLNFMNDALETYKSVDQVMHISGYMFPVDGNLPETFFYRVPSSWGWATWKRAWNLFDNDSNNLSKKIKENKSIKAFNIEGSYFFYHMLRQQSRGKIDSWAVPWYASVFLNKGLCLHPGESLVSNIGHDASGEHCNKSACFDVTVRADRIKTFTSKIEESKSAVHLMSDFYSSMEKSIIQKMIVILNRTRF